ncbi:hypothetical protein SEPCBS119000_004596 [Sporothrix epigloea]|uniref:Rossmann-fold NAD(P)(+)-binding protein n=1 Tax=Sporothrix epigloea TaxID=1892477 RepID=A0ABP0DSZ1_9PEZI
MDINERSTTSHELGLRYLEARQQEELVVKDDDMRRYGVQMILLRGEKSRLEEQVLGLNNRVRTLNSQSEEAHLQLEELNRKCREQDIQLRAQAREHASLRTELLSFSSATADSTKVLTEKLALSREVALLKPEIEHLRSQLAHHKDVLSEKLALERRIIEIENELRQQVHDLENKLAIEKRARKEEQHDTKEAHSASADDIAKAVAEEKRNGMRAKKALETELAEARGQLEQFEVRVSDLKSKLREVREELKSVRTELEHVSSSGQSNSANSAVAEAGEDPRKQRSTAATKAKPKTKAKRTHVVEEPSGPELVLQTPGIGNDGRSRRPLKKKGLDATMAVQKSTFSITPYLSKTTSLLADSSEATTASATVSDQPMVPNAESFDIDKSDADRLATDVDSMHEPGNPGDASELPEDSIFGRRVSDSPVLSSVDISESYHLNASNKAVSVDATGPKRKGRLPKENVLGDASISKKNMKVQRAAEESEASATDAAKSVADGPLTNEQENQPALVNKRAIAGKLKNTTAVSAAVPTENKFSTEAEPKKKKRKILGNGSKILLDGDDDDGIDHDHDDLPRPLKPTAPAATHAGGAVKRTVKALGTGRTTSAAAGKRTVLGGVRNAFGGAAGGGFSPLKRDRRGVNASFLA